MSTTIDRSVSRRRFIQFLAGSPLLAAGSGAAFAQPFLPKPHLPDPLPWALCLRLQRGDGVGAGGVMAWERGRGEWARGRGGR
jgi:hypothetical protein